MVFNKDDKVIQWCNRFSTNGADTIEHHMQKVEPATYLYYIKKLTWNGS